MENKTYLSKGDRVLVWSLQSFTHGGFLQGELAFLRQTQYCGSIILCVIRNIGGEYKIDESYEVFPEQVKLVSKDEWNAKKRLKKFRKKIMKNKNI